MADPPALLTVDQLKALLDAIFGRTDWQGSFRAYHQAMVDGLMNLAQTKAPIDGNWYAGAFAAGVGSAGEAPAPGHAYLWLSTTPALPVLELRDGTGVVLATAATNHAPRIVASLLEDEQAPAEYDADLDAARFGNGGAVAWGQFEAWLDGVAWRVQLEAMMATAEAASLGLALWWQAFGPDDPVILAKRRWQASTTYYLGDLRLPTIPNGRRYRMSSGSGGWSADQCGGGTPLSGGDNGAAPKANAYDDNAGTSWVSSQQGASVSGAAWIGYQFTAGKNVRRLTIDADGDARHYVSSAKAQYADDPAGPWTDVATISIAATGDLQTFDLPDGGSHTCWRLLAQTNTTQYGWLIYEVQMLVPLTTTGTSGTAEPTWPTESGQSVADGEVIWTCDGPGMARLTLATTPPAIALDRFDLDSASLQIPAGAVAAGDRVYFALVRTADDAHSGDLIVNEAWIAPVEV